MKWTEEVEDGKTIEKKRRLEEDRRSGGWKEGREEKKAVEGC